MEYASSMLPRCLRFPGLFTLVLMAAASTLAHAGQSPASAAPAAHTLVLDGLGKGTAPLDGPWQFHLGDDPAWANPSFDDSGWEQLTADKTWGAQGHPSYQGYAWYRRSISITPAPGASSDVALLIPAIDDVYEIYWNGQLVGQFGRMPPHLVVYTLVPPQTYGLGPIRSGVLAIRVWKTVLASNDPDNLGGFESTPLIGSPGAIAAAKAGMDYHWMRGHQFTFGLDSLYTLVALLSFFGWMRDRKQRLLFWLTLYTLSPIIALVVVGLRLPYPADMQQFLTQLSIEVRETALWFLLLWLLDLHGFRKLVRFTSVAAIVSLAAGTLDGLLAFTYPALFTGPQTQIIDAVLTACILPFEGLPVLLVAWALLSRRQLDSGRWLVACFAAFGGLLYWIDNVSVQGVRFTHWPLAEKLESTIFSVNGNPFNLTLVWRTLLFVSIVYAVIVNVIASRRRQIALEQEIQNARELQQVLVPEHLPALAGFTLTSAYKPAQEVGGDFFQIIPLETDKAGGGSTLIVLGDVSGKGLRAAMAVSMIVGAVRTLAETTSSPAQILSGLNRRLSGRLQGGFATAIALRLDRDGSCTLACAGHPAPFVNDQEMTFPGALPLGLTPTAVFEETRLKLSERDRLALYTDGLLEARSQSGELYSFDRLKTLFASQPTAEQAAQAAVNFGQDDDITVLTLTRLAEGAETAA